MKTILALVFTLSLGTQTLFAQTNSNNKVQLAILFDTSGSMDGLIEQAKVVIWQIVNAAGKLRNNGVAPKLEIALYDYGNTTITNTDFVRLQTNLISNLDSISSLLFALSTNGGDEYCGSVIKHGINELAWSDDPNDVKIIYIAGNEPFNQGNDNYIDVLKTAASKNIIVNTIYCGPYEQGVQEFWYDASLITQGNYFNINANDEVAMIATPYDAEINQKNTTLNTTFYSYNTSNEKFAAKIATEDAKANSMGSAVLAERSVSKAGKNYENAEEDLVDAYAQDSTIVLKLKDEQLPLEMRNKSPEEKEAQIKEMQAQREKYKQEINELAKKREEYIAAEKAKRATETGQKDLGSSIIESMNSLAIKKGYTVEK